MENVRSSVIVHEWYGHIKKGFSDKYRNHRLAYHSVIDYTPLWNNTTPNYKIFNWKTLGRYHELENRGLHELNIDLDLKGKVSKYMHNKNKHE